MADFWSLGDPNRLMQVITIWEIFFYPKCSKIVIDCVEKVPGTEYPYYLGKTEGIVTIRYELDYLNFFTKSDYERKQMTLQIIKESLYKIVKEEGLEWAPLEDTCNKIEELDYNNFWVFGKRAKSPSKRYTAELYIEHKTESIDFFAVIRNKQDEIVQKKIIIKEKPAMWAYYKYLGKLVWVSETEINLNDKTGFALFNISL